jgi:hypothetical protein
MLALLEVALSFDNAIVNAKVLESMSQKWRNRFITFGIPIAVFGMRFLFPILLVAIASGSSLLDVVNLSIYNPEKYREILDTTVQYIYAFGGSFLLMVFLDFFFDEEKEVKWIKALEDIASSSFISKIENIELIISILIGIILSYLTADYRVSIAYFSGVLLHSIISSLDEFLTTDGVRNGVVGLIYLEILDASFSFDGVIGAFALTTNIFLIMIGVGIGALFVRSLTLYFVEKGTLKELIYLEHGAHYSIFALSIVMFIKIFIEVNELIIGTLSISFIIISLLHSLSIQKK